MDNLEKYRRRYKRHWSNNNRVKQSLDLMGLTIDDAVEIEMWLNLCGDEPDLKYPQITPKHQ